MRKFHSLAIRCFKPMNACPKERTRSLNHGQNENFTVSSLQPRSRGHPGHCKRRLLGAIGEEGPWRKVGRGLRMSLFLGWLRIRLFWIRLGMLVDCLQLTHGMSFATSKRQSAAGRHK